MPADATWLRRGEERGARRYAAAAQVLSPNRSQSPHSLIVDLDIYHVLADHPLDFSPGEGVQP
eukprot:399540-Hanusia_phi.AAC.1